MVKKKVAGSEENKDKDNIETTDHKEIKGPEAGNPEELTISQEVMPEPSPVEPKPSEAGAADKTEQESRAFEEKLAEMQDRYLRLSAEFDNYRKRTLKEKMEISRLAGEELLKKLLPVMDDFERALKYMETSTDFKSIKEGIDLIYLKMTEFLKQQGIKEIESLNSDFNVDLHDAVAKVPVDEDDKKGKIVDVVLKGYTLQDKVIRHSKVVVGE